MKLLKQRIFAIFMVITLLIGLLPVSALADTTDDWASTYGIEWNEALRGNGSEDYRPNDAVTTNFELIPANTKSIEIKVENVSGIKGTTVEVPISLANNPGIASAKIRMSYDKLNLTPVSYETFGIFKTEGEFESNIDNAASIDELDFVTFVWINSEDTIGNGQVVKVKFTINSETDASEIPLNLIYTEFCNENLELVTGNVTNGKIDVKDVEVLYGDINKDTKIDIRDLVILMQYLAQYTNLPEINLEAADVYKDGKIDDLDLIKLLRYIADWKNIILGSGPTDPPPVDKPEMRAAWISYLEYSEVRAGYNTLLQGQTESQAKANIDEAFDNLASIGVNTAIVQVRPMGDAIYPSKLSPRSIYVSPKDAANRKQGDDPGWDPLQYMIDAARSRDMEIHAWFNPYRVATNRDLSLLADNNQAKIWYQAGSDCTLEFPREDGNMGLSLNPAREEVMDFIADVVDEVIDNYDIDGIHFDDYFYPTLNESFDGAAYKEYTDAGGQLSQRDWRFENVTRLVKKVYDTVHASDKDLVFGISPQGNLGNNYLTQMADVKLWSSKPGYIDYIMPQIYFNFQNQTAPFAETADLWAETVTEPSVALYIGLGAYKIGVYDRWAYPGNDAHPAQTEWMTENEILKRMIAKTRSVEKIGGFTIFDYRSLFKPLASIRHKVLGEIEALKILTVGNPDVTFSLIKNPYILTGSNSTMEWALLNSTTYTPCTNDMDLSAYEEGIKAANGFKVRYIAKPDKEIVFRIAQAEKPNFGFNYELLRINGPIPLNAEYSLDGVNWTVGTSNLIPVVAELGKTYYFKNQIDHLAYESAVQELTVTPAMITAVGDAEYLEYFADGTAVFKDLQNFRYYQYRLNSSSPWIDARKPSGTGTGLESSVISDIPSGLNEIEVRIKYTTQMFASEPKAIPVRISTNKAVPKFTIDYVGRTTAEVVPTTVKYSESATGPWTDGTGAKLSLDPNRTYNLYFIAKGDGTLGDSAVFTLPIQASIVPITTQLVAGSTETSRKLTNLSNNVNYDYSDDDGATWKQITRSSLTNGTCDDFTPAKDTIWVRARGGNGVLQSNHKVLSFTSAPLVPATTPNFTINTATGFTNEAVTAEYEYISYTTALAPIAPYTEWTKGTGTTVASPQNANGRFFYIKKLGDGITTSDSAEQIIKIYAYPAPTAADVKLVNGATAGTKKFTGLNSSTTTRIYEYSEDGTTWLDLARGATATESAEIATTATTLKIRLKGFKSSSVADLPYFIQSASADITYVPVALPKEPMPNFTVNIDTGLTNEAVTADYEYISYTTALAPVVPYTTWTKGTGAQVALPENANGRYLAIRKTGNGTTTSNSDEQKIRVMAYALDNITLEAGAAEGSVKFSGLHSLTTRRYEYSLDNGATWIDVVRASAPNTTSIDIITGATSIQIRLKAYVGTDAESTIFLKSAPLTLTNTFITTAAEPTPETEDIEIADYNEEIMAEVA